MVDSNDALLMNKSINFFNATQTLKVKIYLCDVLIQPVLFVCPRDDPYIAVLLQSCIYCLQIFINTPSSLSIPHLLTKQTIPVMTATIKTPLQPLTS